MLILDTGKRQSRETVAVGQRSSDPDEGRGSDGHVFYGFFRRALWKVFVLQFRKEKIFLKTGCNRTNIYEEMDLWARVGMGDSVDVTWEWREILCWKH